MYALVLTADDTPPDHIPVLVEPDNAWIAIDGAANKVVNGNSGNDGTPPDFAWIGQGFDGDANHARGWEASFSLAEGSYRILAHTNVLDDGESQTSAVDRKTNQAGIVLVVTCGASVPAVEASKADSLFYDQNGNGKVNPGDILLYTVTITNNGSATATSVTYSDTVDANTSLICSAPNDPTTSQGTITSCTPGSGGSLTVAVGDINASDSVTITYKVQVEPGNFKNVANHGTITGDNFSDKLTDDPDTPETDDATVTPIQLDTSDLEVTKADTLAEDVQGNGKVNPGDTIQYTVTITNNGAATASNATFTDTVDGNTTLICSGIYAPQTTQGTISSCTAIAGGSLVVDIGNINPDESVTVTFYVKVNSNGFSSVSNQGGVQKLTGW
jgi:uncharacterized repeat protein (TIGR01451 family)